uniref:Transposase n=1 Tax=Heterorhabditis bacteriophora TaxID=37862 RepID=A0A1I7WC76_HETBA
MTIVIDQRHVISHSAASCNLDVKAKTTMGDELREERNQLARQDASVSSKRRSPLGRYDIKMFSTRG